MQFFYYVCTCTVQYEQSILYLCKFFCKILAETSAGAKMQNPLRICCGNIFFFCDSALRKGFCVSIFLRTQSTDLINTLSKLSIFNVEDQ